MKGVLLTVGIVCLGLFFVVKSTYIDKPSVKSDLPLPHTCIDMTHQVCDPQCECDGLGCGIATNKFDNMMTAQVVPIQDYQLRIDDENDQFIIFDGLRRVGTIKLTDDSEIGALILKDNE